MEVVKGFLDAIKDEEHRRILSEVLTWVNNKYPQLEVAIKWNQPMFIDHGTFIIGFSHAKQHFSFTPEEYTIQIFSQEIKNAGYEHTKGLTKIKWTDKVDYLLLERIIDFNLKDKANTTSFFRK